MMLRNTSPPFSKTQAIKHELINALTSVRCLTELLVDYPGLDSVNRMQFLGIIREETDRLTRLLGDLNGSADGGCSLQSAAYR